MSTPGPDHISPDGPAAESLGRFSATTRDWFSSTFAAPTTAQALAWAAIANGDDTLVIAPTGSGKTLAAFLWALDSLANLADHPSPPILPDSKTGTRVLYVSPLKALAVDIERNLRTPLAGLTRIAESRGQPAPGITVGVRSGDTPPAVRRQLIAAPPDVLITTPESLFLMLTSAARQTLAGVRTIIVDEIHAIAATKRGAHLALSLERLDDLSRGLRAQRIGLSATVRPPEELARFLSGQSPTTIVAPAPRSCPGSGVNREHARRFRFTTCKSAKKESRPCLSAYQRPTVSAPKSTPCSPRIGNCLKSLKKSPASAPSY